MESLSHSQSVTLIMIRHGQSEYNSLGKIQGGGSLDAHGLAQVTALITRFQHSHISHVFVSPTERTRQTASPISTTHNLPIIETDLLTDIDFGDYSGMDAQTAQKKDPELWAKWRTSPHQVSFPNGGNLGMVRSRISTFFDDLLALEQESVILAVTHDSPIRVAASIALGIGDDKHHEFRAQTSSVTTISLTLESKRLIGPFGDISHLTSTGS